MDNSVYLSRRGFAKAAALAGLGLLAAIYGATCSPARALAGASNIASVSFDLSVAGTQETTVLLSDGTETVFGIEVPSSKTRDGYSESLGNGYGDFKTYWYTGLLNIRFWIRVDNYAISYCYDSWAGVLDPGFASIVIDWTDLDWGSYWCRMATRYHGSALGYYETKFIEGRISGTTITYSFWIG